MIVDGERQLRPIDESFDYVIVGSGAAGATAARILSDASSSIAVVEEGPAVDATQFEDRTFASLRRLYRDMGAQVARGRAYIPVLQGSCLGGSTVVNSAIMWRLPEDVWTTWDRDHSLGRALPLEELHRHWDQIEAELSVGPTPRDVWGGNNSLMERAGQVMRISAGPMRRAVRDCRGSARCQAGCPFDAKQSMALTYLPYAERRGTTLFTRARADGVVVEGGRAVAVEGRLGHAPAGRRNPRFRLHARKAVLVAASAIQTPGLLRRSGVRSPHLGAHLQVHPGASLIGVFDQQVDMWFGATQGFESDQHRRDGRFKIESVSLSPELLFARLPGVGPRWARNIAQASHMAMWAVDLRAEAEGAVGGRAGRTLIRYGPGPRDMANLRAGLRLTAEMLFAAGAREVLPGIHGVPERITRPDDVALIGSGPDDPRAYVFSISHMFGTARMARHKEAGVVGPDFAVHGIDNLFVVDSSVFPTNTGVNPQLSIMGLAMHAANGIRDREA